MSMGLTKFNEQYIKKSLIGTDQHSRGSTIGGEASNGRKDSRIAEESHHAMHALLFFVIMLRQTLSGKRIKRRLLGRIMHHLMDLREFLAEGVVNDLANDLYTSVQNEYEKSLPLFRRVIHKGTRTVAHTLDPEGRRRFFQAISSLLIVSCESEKSASICMYPWLVENQARILEFARSYAKESVFKGLIPLSTPQPLIGGQQK